MNDGQRRLAAILFTDIVGYSALSHRDPAVASALLAEHRKLLRPCFAGHGGREVKTIGDAFLVEFASPLAAIQCAIRIQQTLASRNARIPAGKRVRARIGIHLGEVVSRETDVHGDAVNIASRLQFLAAPGGICFSQHVFDQVRGKLELAPVALDERRLRNIDPPVRLYSVLPIGHADIRARLIHRMQRNSHAVRRAALALLALGLLFPWEVEKKDHHAETGVERTRIAVLPFRSISSSAKVDDYISDGMTEELITALSRVPGLRVIARSSVMRYKDVKKSAEEIRSELRVGMILEGSVGRVEDKLRVSVRLVEARTQENVWTHEFDGRVDDILGIQATLARRVSAELRGRFVASPAPMPRKASTVGGNVTREAYLAYLRGRHALARRTETSLWESVEHFKSAAVLDSRFSSAYAGLANSFTLLSWYGFLSPRDAAPQAQIYSERALVLDPGSAEAVTAMAEYKAYYLHDWVSAEREFRRALVLDPGYSVAHQWYSEFLVGMGRTGDAQREIRLAQDLDPFSSPINTAAGHPLYFKGDFEAASRRYLAVVEADPEYAPAHFWLGRSYAQRNLFDQAIAVLEKALRLSPGSARVKAALACALAGSGKKEPALKLLSELEAYSGTRYVSAYDLAGVYASLGNRERAFEQLTRADDERSNHLLFIQVDPALAALRDDPRFASLRRGTGF